MKVVEVMVVMMVLSVSMNDEGFFLHVKYKGKNTLRYVG
jgi:hypothetical protein